MIQFESVNKTFPKGRRPALHGVSFAVKEGEIFGLLGHNGAGKSTALGVLLGLVHPDSGEASIGGISVQKQREKALKSVGAIFESPRFYEYLSGWRNLKVLTSYSGYWKRAEVDEIVRWMGLTEAIHRKVATYSFGMRQRLALAQALLPRPRVLLLDEPASGLDPDGIVEFRERVRRLREEFGMTVVLNSHMLTEVEQLCDRVVILRNGEVAFEGRLAESGEGGTVYELSVDNWELARPTLELLPVKISGEGRVGVPDGIDPSDLVAGLVKAGVKVREFRKLTTSLESIYLSAGQHAVPLGRDAISPDGLQLSPESD
jgi:ABC-2 type transport system ATP-binding protein